MKTPLAIFGAVSAALLLLGAGVVHEISYQRSVSVAETNFVSEEIVTNGMTVGGVRRTTWPVGGANPDWSDVVNKPIGLVSNNVATTGLLAVDGTKTNGIAATPAHIVATLGFTPATSNANLAAWAAVPTSDFQPTSAITNYHAAPGSNVTITTNTTGTNVTWTIASTGGGTYAVTNYYAAAGVNITITTNVSGTNVTWTLASVGPAADSIWQTNLDGTVTLVNPALTLSLSGTLLADTVTATNWVISNLTSSRVLYLNATNKVESVASAGLLNGDGTAADLGSLQTAAGFNIASTSDPILESRLVFSPGSTTGDATSTAHGFAPQGNGDPTSFLNGNLAWSHPAGNGQQSIFVTGNSTSTTPVIIWTNAINTNQMVSVSVTIMGNGLTNALSEVVHGSWRREASDLYGVGNPCTNTVSFFATTNDISGYLYASGTNLYIQVTGRSGNVWNWQAAGSFSVMTNGVPVDTDPPVISAISTNTPVATEATISWTTDKLATSGLRWGTDDTMAGGSATNATTGLNHALIMSPLTGGTLYYYQVFSSSEQGVLASSDTNTFTTPASWTYYATAFDGSTDLALGAALSGVSDNAKGGISFWFKLGASNSVTQIILEEASNDFYVSRGSDNKMALHATSSGGSTAINMYSTTTYTTNGISGVWHHFLAGWDLTVPSTYMYIDGANVKAADTPSSATLNLDRTNWYLGADTAGIHEFNGSLSEVVFWTGTYVDATTALTRLVSGGHPIYIGANGENITGSSPAFYLHNGFATFGTDNGTNGNDFSVTAGTLTDDPTLP